ncbi:MAG: choice-of-anchor D domain-containing protein [Pseudomonadota bacterium]
MRRLLSMLALLTACSPDYGVEQLPPSDDYRPIIEVEPQLISFGAVPVGQTVSDVFTVANTGSARLSIDAMTLIGSGTFGLTQVDFSDGVAPDEIFDVVVTFTPTLEGAMEEGAVQILSSDPTSPQVSVELRGGLDVPALSITPNPLDFGDIRVGSPETGTLTLTSVGQSPITLESFSISGHAFSGLEGETWPLTLDPGDDTTMEITFDPQAGGDFAETITVNTASPAESATAELIGWAEASGPIAVCSVDPTEVQPNHDTATWYGNESYDAAGYAITDYEWALITKPGGSTATMPSGGADRRNFRPDLAGEYVGQLVVTNELGQISDPCTATLTATPVEDLWIQMYWTHSGDDMDLHLLKPGGTLVSNTDCYYANCVGAGLDWGVRSDTTDNPSLDMDDIPGTGPENINIESPESGTFEVYVHDYPGSVYNGANDVTVVIFVGGYQVWTDTRNVATENSYVPFADISWPAGTVTSR